MTITDYTSMSMVLESVQNDCKRLSTLFGFQIVVIHTVVTKIKNGPNMFGNCWLSKQLQKSRNNEEFII